MNKSKVYSIFDQKSLIYSHPFFLSQDGQAIRAFTDMVNDKSHDIGRHPQDYILFQTGEWCDQTGTFVNIDNKSLGVGSEYVTVQ